MVQATSDEGIRLRLEVEDFLYHEADLLDEHRYEEWLELFTEDVRYRMPIKRNVPSKELERENSALDHEISWFDNDKDTLTKRVKQVRSGMHWAEEPYSRVSHLVANVRLLDSKTPGEVRVGCRFIYYRNRFSDEESTFIGTRVDTLRRVNGVWKICNREIYLDQSVMLFKNFTGFF